MDQRDTGPDGNCIRVPRAGCRVWSRPPSNLRRNCPVPANCPAGADIPPWQDAGRRACGRDSETEPTLALEPNASSPPYRPALTGRACYRRAYRSVGKRVSGSRLRIRAACLKPNAVARPDREENAPPIKVELGRSSCLRRSPIGAVPRKVSHEPLEGDCRNGLRCWRLTTGISSRRYPALTNSSRQHWVILVAVGGLSGRHKFRDRVTAVGHDDRLAGSGEANVFAKLVLEELEADGAHARQSGYQGPHCQTLASVAGFSSWLQ